ncbi:Dabb family protein [Hominifimenecus sp. rT4P-3]|uniref:Dabb family protein n=1 Tax=Hominifimenecus sp. rT4P-3 TaxID=3242979 RepID=UPI003DA68398
MIRHVVSWNYKEEVSAEKKEELYAYFKEAFSALKEKVPGVISISVGAPPLPSSTKELCLYVEMQEESVLPLYAGHPDHLAIVEVIKRFCQDRCCVDF